MAKARASGDVIMVNGKQPMTERRYQAELMKDVHKFIENSKDVTYQA